MTVTRKLRILLADDHETVREGLKTILNAQPDMEVIGEAADGRAALVQARELMPDVLLMDVSMPRVNGLKATEALAQCCPGIRIVTLTRHADDGYLQQLLHAGASGTSSKQSRAAELLHAIRAVARGGQYLDPAIAARVVGNIDAGPRRAPSRLLPRLEPAGGRDSSACRLGLQQQGDRRAADAQRQDRRDPQDECDAEARPSQPHRHRPLSPSCRAG